MKRILGLMAALVLSASVTAAPAAASATAPAFVSSFQKPPSAALKALKATLGKEIKTGFVFIDGKYIPPPYVVARYGNTIRINGIQVTPELIAWDEFLKTQEGVTVSKTESAPAEVEPEEPEEEEDLFDDDDDSESSLDDLFDDEPTPKKSAKKSAPKRKAKPKPKKPTVTVSVSFDGTFEPNDKTKAYVEKINATRTRIDKQLRGGGYYFFGSRYAALSGDAGAARHMLEKMPEIMRDSTTAEKFNSAMFSGGFVIFPPALIADIYRHRYEYPRLLSRRKALEEDRKWSNILGK